MNKTATGLLSEAATFIAKGEQFYRKAAEKILAAKQTKPKPTNAQIGKYVGEIVRGKSYGATWVRGIEAWAQDSADSQCTPFGGEAETQRVAGVHAKRILREAPLEQVEQIISTLPAERQQAIAGAAGNAYHKARQDYRETERSMTPAQRKEREAVGDKLVQPVRKALAGFTTLGIEGHLEQALEELRELNADGPIPKTHLTRIRINLELLVEEYQVAAAMAGLDADLEMQS